ncbi:uncharacterized protein LOC131023021 [Salvia miltiorrhiza]|uniref:uncharacterized protein LOC131023021 n=1 Tax=Salvia miltiorrhiza TaxID=226208 RepID=UPI0025ACEE99|nr:uncharacterized protein LOC131023021 [Salvia miltiorrhiza]
MCSNIWIFTQPDVRTNLIFASDQVVIVDCDWQSKNFRVAVVHGASTYLLRRELWIDILNHAVNNFVVLGDFNAVKGAHERSSNCRPNITSCEEFGAFINALGCIESPVIGLKYTWSGRRFMPSHVESKLDRAFYSDSFANSWHTVFSQILPRNTSDHSPLVLRCQSTLPSSRKFFRFLNMWTLHPGFLDLVKASWSTPVDNSCPIYTVMIKLKRLRTEIRNWNKSTFGNVDLMIMEKQQDLSEIQEKIAVEGYTEDLFDKEILAQASINDILSVQLGCKMGIGILISSTTCSANIVEVEAILDPIISDQQNSLLSAIPNEEEITAAVFQMDSNSSPGPDGFSGKFFHHCWDIIKKDIWRAVITFFVKSYLPLGCNANTLILIPKKDSVVSVADLRPIVLSNFFFKIISKVLAVRLSVVAAQHMSSNQFGFISGRSIHDCIMLGSEGINCLRRSSGGQNMACKVDISKAFDTLRWDFLLNVLKVCGYTSQFIKWIEVILSSARLSILYNGELRGFFGCSRGVRGVFFPTHLLYADDILIFCKATKTNVRTLLKVLNFYADISGQVFSPSNSQIIFSDRIAARTKRQVTRILALSTSDLPFTYLGVPMFRGKPKAFHLQAIHDRIVNKFARWKDLQLSMAGRLCLINSVISSSLTHSMMMFRWPRSLLKNLDTKCRNFLWNGDTSKQPSCSVSWDRVCAIKAEGGLGVRSFLTMNKSFLMKMAWRVIDGNSFGYDIMKRGYLTSFCKVKTVAPSSIWSGLREEVGDLVWDSFSYIGKGDSTLFWLDDWLGYRLADKCGVPFYMKNSLNQTVADYFFDGIWHFTQDFVNSYPLVVCDILLLPIGNSDVRF